MITKSKFLKALAAAAMALGGSGVTVYAEPTPAPSETPTVAETTPEPSAEASAAPSASSEATPKASASPSASPESTPEATPEAPVEPTPTMPPAVTAAPIEVSPWLSDWTYTVDADAHTVTISEYLPEAPLVDGHPDTFGWNVDIVVPATAEINGETYQTVLASRISMKETMASASSMTFEPGVKMQPNSSYLFDNIKVASIDCSGLDVSGVTDLSHAFDNWNFRSINLSGLDLSSVTNMDEFIRQAINVSYITAPAKLPDGVSIKLPNVVDDKYVETFVERKHSTDDFLYVFLLVVCRYDYDAVTLVHNFCMVACVILSFFRLAHLYFLCRRTPVGNRTQTNGTGIRYSIL